MKTSQENLPIPNNEIQRLQVLREYNILDTLPEEQFDRLTKLAAIICEAPIALISLVDSDRQWFKSKVGLEVHQTSRDISFCQYTIMGEDFFEVEDVANDKRFSENLLVIGNPKIRFYAAYPLIDPNGFALGSLCIIDQVPKRLTVNQKAGLKTLSEDIMLQMVSNKKNEERRKLERFFLMSLDLICMAGTDGYFKKINPAFTQTLGWTEEELLQKPFFDFIHPDDLESTKEEISKLAKGISTVDFINRYRTNNGSYRLLQWVANPDPITGDLFAIGRDNTLLKKIKTENEVSATTIEQLNSALNESAIVTVTDSDGKIDFVNEAFIKVSKYSLEEIIGQDHKILNSDFHSLDFYSEIWKTVKSGKIWKGEIINRCKDGTFFWTETTIVPFFDIDKKPVRYILIRYDVTERVQLENALRKSKTEIEKTVKIKEQFLANMSHEIRTPLNAIIGFSEILRASKLTPGQAEHAKIISKSGENLMGIINDILDFTKIESGNINLEKVPLSINEILDNIKKMFYNVAKEKQIGLKVFSDNDIPPCVIGDPVRITQILVNLVGNGIKFTKNGSIQICCSIISQKSDKVLIEFKIKDTGIGIPNDKLDIIFERFVQAEHDTTRKFGGTGLGLSIVKNIVKLMDGEITVESKLGKGSIFTVSIPAESCTDEQIKEFTNTHKKSVLIDSSILGKLNLLLVEDNRMNQQYVSTVLQQLGFECDIASDGIEAIKMVNEKVYDIILMDIQMPRMDGYETTQIIRNDLKIETPIIALTANATSNDYEKCMSCGMNGYISKPYKPNDLHNKIAETLGNKMFSKSGGSISGSVESKLNNDKLVDLYFIKEQVNGKMDAVKQLFDIFMEDTPREIEALEDAIIKKNYVTIEKISHHLVSSYSIIGIETAVKVLKMMEHKANQKKEIGEIKKMFRILIEITVEAKKEITELNILK